MYPTNAIRKAYSLSRSRITGDLSRAGVYGPFTGWTKDELASVWLEHYGGDCDQRQARLDADCGPLCAEHGDPRDTSIAFPVGGAL